MFVHSVMECTAPSPEPHPSSSNRYKKDRTEQRGSLADLLHAPTRAEMEIFLEAWKTVCVEKKCERMRKRVVREISSSVGKTRQILILWKCQGNEINL